MQESIKILSNRIQMDICNLHDLISNSLYIVFMYTDDQPGSSVGYIIQKTHKNDKNLEIYKDKKC